MNIIVIQFIWKKHKFKNDNKDKRLLQKKRQHLKNAVGQIEYLKKLKSSFMFVEGKKKQPKKSKKSPHSQLRQQETKVPQSISDDKIGVLIMDFTVFDYVPTKWTLWLLCFTKIQKIRIIIISLQK